MNKRKALGRGLDALLGNISKREETNLFEEIDINKIRINSQQPRSYFNLLTSL